VTSDPEACALQQIEADYLHNAIARLPDKFRMVIMLADEQGLSYEEIARIMRSPVGTVRSRLHRSRRMLAHRLRGYAREAGHLSPAGITT
jgi:RNA polymerase sigma-70 factor (ECF subfamily)